MRQKNEISQEGPVINVIRGSRPKLPFPKYFEEREYHFYKNGDIKIYFPPYYTSLEQSKNMKFSEEKSYGVFLNPSSEDMHRCGKLEVHKRVKC